VGRTSVVAPLSAVLSAAIPAVVGIATGVYEAVAAGAGFAVLFIGLARAGTSSGAWPLVPGQAVAVTTAVGIGLVLGSPGGTWRAAWWPAVLTGILGGSANLLYLAATGHGQLSVVAVVTALYPAVTVVLARAVLDERWGPLQALGLWLSKLAVALISVS